MSRTINNPLLTNIVQPGHSPHEQIYSYQISDHALNDRPYINIDNLSVSNAQIHENSLPVDTPDAHTQGHLLLNHVNANSSARADFNNLTTSNRVIGNQIFTENATINRPYINIDGLSGSDAPMHNNPFLSHEYVADDTLVPLQPFVCLDPQIPLQPLLSDGAI